eukprot:68473-Pleurochrysis_carterae.AAC.6
MHAGIAPDRAKEGPRAKSPFMTEGVRPCSLLLPKLCEPACLGEPVRRLREDSASRPLRRHAQCTAALLGAGIACGAR